MRRHLAALSTLALLAGLLCLPISASAETGGPAVVSVRIVAPDGRPLAGATASLFRLTGPQVDPASSLSGTDDAVAGPDGSIRFEGARVGGRYTIRASTPGYRSRVLGGGLSLSMARVVTAKATSDAGDLVLPPSRGLGVDGLLVDQDGRPIPDTNAELYEWKDGAWETSPYSSYFTRVLGGRFARTFDRPGTYTILFGDTTWLGGGRTRPTGPSVPGATITVDERAPRADAGTTVMRLAPISGRLVDRAGVGVAGGTVTASMRGSASELGPVTTDADGHYSLPGAEVGASGRVDVWSDLDERDSVSVTEVADGGTTVDDAVVDTTSSVHGRLQGEGRRWVGERVNLWWLRDERWQESSSLTVGDDLTFRSGPLPAGTYTAQLPDGSWLGGAATRDGAERFVLDAERPAKELELDTGAGSRLHGTVTREGVPLEGARVTLCLMWSGNCQERGNATAGPDGRYEFEGLVGDARYSLRVSDADGSSWRYLGDTTRDQDAEEVAVAPNSTVGVHDVELPQLVTITGVVSDPQGTLAQFPLELSPVDNDEDELVGSRTTDDKGRFTYTNLRPGRYSLRLDTGSYSSEDPKDIIVAGPGQTVVTADRTVQLPDQWETLAGRLVDAEFGLPLAGVSATVTGGPTYILPRGTSNSRTSGSDGRLSWKVRADKGQVWTYVRTPSCMDTFVNTRSTRIPAAPSDTRVTCIEQNPAVARQAPQLATPRPGVVARATEQSLPVDAQVERREWKLGDTVVATSSREVMVLPEWAGKRLAYHVTYRRQGFSAFTVSAAATVASKATPKVVIRSTASKGRRVSVAVTMSTKDVGRPTGKVTLKDGTTTLASGYLKNGKVVLKGRAKRSGSRVLTVVYAGSSKVKGVSHRFRVTIKR